MNKKTLKLVGLGIAVVSMVGLLSLPLLAGQQQGSGKMRMGTTPAASMTRCRNMRKMHMKKLTRTIEAIDKATAEVKAGNKTKALLELAQARKLLLECHQAVAKMGKGKIINDRCPIMGSKLNPDKVPTSLTRSYKGKTVGFCCASCPVAWDKLSDKQKQEKLDKHPTSSASTTKKCENKCK